ncbi:hypothetical protein [Nocardioides ochotonae]|uniref:hypothetical protein n=1 Tax=Nocardioides ochotonae TaxID=2685869 RepID=UPI00140B2F7B|nr:hypothetical protein [Nocardioides ochotonae]
MELALGVSEFLDKVPPVGSSIPPPMSKRRVPIPPGAYRVNARHALERAVTLDRFGTKTLSVRKRDLLIEQFSTIAHLQLLEEIARREDERPRTDPGWLGALEAATNNRVVHIDYVPGAFDLVKHLTHAQVFRRDYDEGDLEIYASIADAIKDGGATGDPTFDALSEAMKVATGFSLIELISVFGELRNAVGDVEVGRCRYVDLRDHIHRVASNYGANFVDPFDYLMFQSDSVALTDLKPGALRWQPVRLTTHPIVRSGDWVFVIRDLMFQAVIHYVTSLLIADWPATSKHRKETIPAFEEALRAAKAQRGKRFEEQIAARLDSAGVPNASINHKARCGQTTMRREIDHLAVDVHRKILWILEDKDLVHEGTLLSIRSTLDEFLQPKGYLSKLLMSVEDVAVDPHAVADHVLRLSGHASVAGPWDVRAAFVIRDLGPMAHVVGLPVDVVSARGVAERVLTG